jgi:glutamate-1-semialdehyde 2,1-aminomutase
MLTVFLRPGPVRTFAEASASDLEAYGALFRHLLARGVYIAPSQFEATFVATVHGPREIDRTASAASEFAASRAGAAR